jgi:pimeloyl-ACP methyl ester carboxylesterase
MTSMRRAVPFLLAGLLTAACGSVASGDALVESTRPIGSAGSETPTTTGGSGPSSATTAAGSATTKAPTSGGSASTLSWQSCGKKLECTTLTVPKDYDDAAKGTLDLFLKRRPADRKSSRIGSLLVNPGGPGVAGTELADQAAAAFGPDLLLRFDIVGWDPRGTGKSGEVQCVKNLDPYFAIDQSAEDAAESKALVDAAKDFAAQCQKNAGDLLPYISTEATARDMDSIRKALGEDEISYFGFSYGSELGAVWATLFPSTVRAVVLDGASDVNADSAEDLKQQTIGLERVLDSLLADCAKDRSCAIYNNGKPGEVYDRVMAALDVTPLTVPNAPGRPPVNQGVASIAVTSVLYTRDTWPLITSAIAEAENGNGKPLLDLYDAYLTGFGQHAFEALIAIRCIDSGGHDDTDLVALDKELRAIAPRLGQFAIGTPFCADWPAKGKVEPKVTGAGAGPIVVVGTTGDPVTPIEASANLAKSLEQGVLVTVQAEQHTGYGTSVCIDNAVDDYLISLKVPEAGKTCKASG